MVLVVFVLFLLCFLLLLSYHMKRVREDQSSVMSEKEGPALPAAIWAHILSFSLTKPRDLHTALSLNRSVREAVLQSLLFWERAARVFVPSGKEIFAHDGNWQAEWKVQNHCLALDDKTLQVEGPVPPLRIRRLVELATLGQRLEKHIFAHRFFEDESHFFTRWGYVSTEVFAFFVPSSVTTINDAFKALWPSGNIFESSPDASDFVGFEEVRGQDALEALGADVLNSDAEEDPVTSVSAFSDEEPVAEPGDETQAAQIKDFVAQPFPQRELLRYGRGNGPNCDDLVDVLYWIQDGVMGGLFIYRNW